LLIVSTPFNEVKAIKSTHSTCKLNWLQPNIPIWSVYGAYYSRLKRKTKLYVLLKMVIRPNYGCFCHFYRWFYNELTAYVFIVCGFLKNHLILKTAQERVV